MNDAQLIDYAKSLDCIHCGLCLSSCPTYALTGAEPSSPRGRIHLMRSVAEGTLVVDDEFAEEMDFCLLCRTCESVCPSGVQFGALMEHTRFGLDAAHPRPWFARLARWLGFRVILSHRFALRSVAAAGRMAQSTGLLKFVARLAGARGRALLDAPLIPSRPERALLPGTTPARGTQRGSVAVLQGCVMPELFGHVNRATTSVLTACGYECRVPQDHVCCGSLHAHNGDRAGARMLAQRTITAFEGLLDSRGEPVAIVVNSAGCGAHMKEYAHLFDDDPEWKARALRFSARVRDFSEFLAVGEAHAALVDAIARAGNTLPAERVTWDDPCHLCHAQKVRTEPRTLLASIPGIERIEMKDSERCCGSAGLYSLLRPSDASAVLEPKLRSLAQCGATTLVTGNPGCQLQWLAGVARAHLPVRVVHIAELLATAVATRDD